MPERRSVREGNTGILYLSTASGAIDRYIPNYDLDAAHDLLLRFQALRDRQGRLLKDNYRAEGFNWYPTVVNYLYHHVFVSFVRYEKLARALLDGSLDVVFENRGRFEILTQLLVGPECAGDRARAFNWALERSNRVAARRARASVLFCRSALNDFRTEPARSAFEELGVRYTEAIGGYRALLVRNLATGCPRVLYGRAATDNAFRHAYVLDGLDEPVRVLFSRAIERIERLVTASIEEYRSHVRSLRRARFRVLYAIDDTQVLYPLIYACHTLGIRTVAHQHGAAYNRRHASYVMEGIPRADYRWFDTLVTWGQFWRDRILAVSEVYAPDSIVVGSDLFGFHVAPRPRSRRPPRNILVPYEWVANTYQVGRYVARLQELGYRVFFKIRPDEDVEGQVESYCLSGDQWARLRIVDRLTPELMDEIDAVAGTASTLLYQLLPSGRPVWVLDTDYRYAEDLVELGLAHRVRYEALDALAPTVFESKPADPTYLFGEQPLSQTLATHVLAA